MTVRSVGAADAGALGELVDVGRMALGARMHHGAGDIARQLRAADRNVALISPGDPPSAALFGDILAWDEPRGLWMDLWVPDGAHQGSAAGLWEAIARHCRAHGVDGLRTVVTEDRAATIAFLTRRGFREVERDQEVVMRMTARPAVPDAPDGVEVVTLAERPGLLSQLVALDEETVGDIPGEEGVDVAPSNEGVWASSLESGVFRPSTTVMAVAGDGVLAYSTLRHPVGESAEAWVEYTATRPEARGRGLAVLVKRAQAVAAWDEGVRRIWAWNHLDNAAMRAVNRALGYERGPDALHMALRDPRW